MKFFCKEKKHGEVGKENTKLDCLFQKHTITKGKIVVEDVKYWEPSNKVYISFEVSADTLQHRFSTSIPFNPSRQEVLDEAFDKVYEEMDKWLAIAKQFDTLKNSLHGKVVFEWIHSP